ncbi:YadA-like family protein [Kerstersia similis]|uniref:YadA-like family protein n=1 Tax=Kerstersia similis TaxID=206505 RepID=UPI0039F0586D
MNKAYRNVWSEATGTFVAVAENVKARGKRSSSAKTLATVALAVAALGATGAAQADVTLDGSTPVVTDGTEIIFENGAGKITFTDGGEIDFGATGGKITGLNDGALNGTSSDAVTGKQLHATNQNVTTLQGDLSVAQGNITTLQGDMTTAKGDITTLKGDVTTAKGDITTLKGDMTTAKGDITTLKSDVTTAKGNITTLQTDLGTAKTDITTLQGDLDALQNGTASSTGYAGVKYFRVNSDEPDAQAAGEDAIAVGPNAVATGDASVAIGLDSEVKGKSSIALGDGAKVDAEYGADSIAIGTDAAVVGNASSKAVALGANATASAANATALGAGANASGAGTVALGGASASSQNGIAIGQGATATAEDGISIGTGAGTGMVSSVAGDRTHHIAIGAQSGTGVEGNQNIAMGLNAGSNVKGDNNLAFGSNAGGNLATGDGNIAIGTNANMAGGSNLHNSIAIGGDTSSGSDSVVVGYKAIAADGAVAAGAFAQAQGVSVALGRNASANGNNVALGEGSIARDLDYQGKTAYLGTGQIAAGGAVSVGAAPIAGGSVQSVRRVINVAAGSDTYDAVNVGQLRKTQEMVGNLVGGTTVNADGTFSRIYLGKDGAGVDQYADSVVDALQGITGGTINVLPAGTVQYTPDGRIANVTAGNAPTDAVNVQQMEDSIEAGRTRYVSINSVETPNEDNTGASGLNAIAIGPRARAAGLASTAMGAYARAEKDNSIALGNGTAAEGVSSTVVGDNSYATGAGGISLGLRALGQGDNSIVIGTDAQADPKANGTVNNAVVIGTSAEVTEDHGIAIGFDAVASEKRAIAQGDNALASGVDSSAVGTGAMASGTNAAASGTRAAASGNDSIASGTNAQSYANSGIAMGTGAVAGRVVQVPDDALQNFNSTAIGAASKATALDSTALGHAAEATGEQALAVGDTTKVSGKQATGVGASNTVAGTQAFAGGYSNTVNGQGASTVGNQNSVAAAGAGAFGNSNELTSQATNSRAVGNNNQISANNSFVVGNGNNLAVSDAFVLGNNASVANAGGVAIGSGSASTAAAGVAGYVANAAKNNASNTSAVNNTQSTAAAVAVGSASVRRQITGVAAGTADTDAVNVAQLKSTGWNIATGGTSGTAQTTHVSAANGDVVDIGLAATENNLDVTRSTTGNTTTVAYSLKKNLDLGSTGSVKTGDTTLNNAGVQITHGGNVTNVGAGSVSVSNGTNTVTVNSSTGTVNGLTNKTFNANNFTSGQAATEDQLKQVTGDLTTLGFAIEDESGNKIQKSLGESAPIVGDGNIETAVQNGKLVVGLADNVDVSQNLTVGGNSSVGGTLNVGGPTTLNSTLQVAGNTTLAGGATIGNNLTVNPSTNVHFGGNQLHGVDEGTAGTDAVNVNQLNTTKNDIIAKGFALKAQDGQTVQKSLGEAIDVVGGDANVVTLVDNGQVKVKLADSVSVKDNLTVGGNSTVIGNSSVTGNSTVGGTLNVTGSTTLVGGADISNHLTVNPGATVNMGGNKITNVAKGTDGTDAVNFEQLTELANRPLGFSADQGAPVSRKLGETLAVNGADSNIVTKTTAANGIEIELAKNLDLGSAGSIKLGDTTVNNGGLSIVGGPSVTKTGINANGTKITNVVAGSDDTDAVNVSQLNDVKVVASKGWNLSAQGIDASNVAPGATVDLSSSDGNIDITKGATDGNVKFALADTLELGTVNVSNNLTVGGTTNLGDSTLVVNKGNVTYAPNTTIDMGGNKITNVSKGEAPTDAVNVEQLTELANTPLGFSADQGTPVSRKLGETLAVNGADSNIVTKTTAANGIEIELAKNLDLGSAGSITLGDTTVNNGGLSIVGGPSVTKTGINANGTKITNVVAGSDDTDAVNVSQLNDVKVVANKGWNLSANGADTTNVKPGDTVDLTDADGNIVVKKGSATDPHQVTFGLSDTLDLGTVNVSNNLTVGGTTNLGDSTLVVNKGNVTYAPNTTIDMGGNKVTNVSKGEAPTDAVNVEQLTELANTPLTFVAGDGSKVDRKLGQEVSFTTSNTNLSTTTTADGIQVALADDLVLDSVKTGNTLINNSGVQVGQNVQLGNTGLVIANGPSVTNTGIDAGDKIIQNVKAGVADTDGVNVSQLKGVENVANMGWKLSANGADTTNVKPGETVDLTDADGNIVVKKGSATDPHQVTFGLSDTLNLGTVNVSNNLTVGGTTNLGNNTFIVKEGEIKVAGGTTVNMGGNKITNVAKGTDGSDVVNKDQLDELANTPLYFAAESGADLTRKLGQTVKFTGSNANLSTTTTADGVEIALSDKLDLGVDGSVKTGDTVVNNAGVKVGDDVTLNNAGLVINGGPSVIKSGIDAGGTKITNVLAGSNDTDAVNVSQLKDVEVIAKTGWQLSVNGNAAQDQSQVKPGDVVDFSNDADGNIIIDKTDNNVVVKMNRDLDLDSVTTGQTVMNNDGVKVGNDVFLSSDGLRAGDVIISAVTGINAGGKRITNVAPGIDPTDAVNVSQLKDVEQKVGNLDDRAVKYDGNVGDPKNKITLEGDVSTDGGKTGGTTITNVARGEISENSTDAINGSQIKEMGDSIAEGMGGNSTFVDGKLVTELNVGGNTYNNVNDALNGVNNELNTKIENVAEVANAGWQIDTNGEGSSKVAPGKTVNFVGGSNIEISRETTADGNNNVTVGLAQDIAVNTVTAKTVTADTVNAKEVVIENGPVLNQNGIDMRSQRIVNLADGQAPNDAVNVSQLEAATGNLQNQVNNVRGDLHKLDNKLSAGVAAAMATAGLPQAYLPGKSMAAIAGGTWNGESGFAIGVSTISDNGKWVMKLSGNTSSRGDFGGAVGVGYQW